VIGVHTKVGTLTLPELSRDLSIRIRNVMGKIRLILQTDMVDQNTLVQYSHTPHCTL